MLCSNTNPTYLEELNEHFLIMKEKQHRHRFEMESSFTTEVKTPIVWKVLIFNETKKSHFPEKDFICERLNE